MLQHQSWRGNVRELENVVTQVLIRIPEEQTVLTCEDFDQVLGGEPHRRERPAPRRRGLPWQRRLRKQSAPAFGRPWSAVAETRTGLPMSWGCPWRTLYYKCKRLGIGQ